MIGKFIVFEGIDGSGTSTQSDLLKKALTKKKTKCHLTCEPSNGPVGNLIRQIFKGRMTMSKGQNPLITTADLFDEQMAYLFAADRHDHLFNSTDGVFNLTSKGDTVISTRYFFSSYAYHCSNQNDFEFVRTLNARFPNPDLVIYLDNPADVSINRMNERAFKDEYENSVKLTKAKQNYATFFSTYDGKLLTLNATNSVEHIHNEIMTAVDSLYVN